MEESLEEQQKKTYERPLLGTQGSANAKGGFRTLPFIIANEAFESLASNGLQMNMIMYLTKVYGMGHAYAANLLFLFATASYVTPVIGALIADSFTGKFRMISYGCLISLLGVTFMWLTTFLPHSSTSTYTSASACHQLIDNTCRTPIVSEIILYVSFGFMSIGAGGIRSCSLPFGADQLDIVGANLENKRILESYFSWYYASVTASVLIAASCIVYIQEQIGWKVGFGIPVLLMLFSALSFFLASPFYVKSKPKSSLLTGYAQVLVASYRNRKLQQPSLGNEIYHQRKGSKLLSPSETLKCLNKACIVKNPEQDLTLDGQAVDPWRLCTVDQVEDVKAIIRIIPMWSTAIVMNVSIAQGSLKTLMADTMDRHITSTFEIPAATFGMFLIIFIIFWVMVYNRIIIPIASKVVGRPVYISAKHRMGIGMLCNCVSMAAVAILESVRRTMAIKKERPISAMWLLLHYILAGAGEGFSAVGQNEFYYSELPKSMSSIALSLMGVGIAFGNLASSAVLTLVDSISKAGGKTSWISNDINKGHFDYYFWLITALSVLNFVYFIACSKAYGPCNKAAVRNNEDDIME